jgi:hypothetical protein
MDTIREDVNDSTLDVDSATSAFLDRWKDPKEASKNDEGAKDESKETIADESDTTDDEVEDQDQEGTEDPNEDTEEGDEDKTPAKAAKVAEDDAEVTFTVDGVEHKASVKDLKRLAGQEASLTRKSQEVAAKTKEVEDTRILHVTALHTLVDRAEEAYRPYGEIDWLVASKEMSPEDFAAVRAEATAKYKDYQFLTEELGGAMQKVAEAQDTNWKAQADTCIKVLSDPTTGIEGWGKPLYDEIRTYAKTGGMDASIVDRLTDPVAFKMLHKAMSFDKIKSVATVKKATSAKKVLKSSGNIVSAKQTPSEKSAMAKLKSSGSRDDAVGAFLSRMEDTSAD